MWATTLRSWVMRIREVLRSRCMVFSTSRTWAWMVTSRAVVGSSQMRILGLEARAMAITILCRMPPEKWKGYWLYRSSGWGIPTAAMSSMLRFFASALGILCKIVKISEICFPTFLMGFKELRGSWKIMAISLPRSFSQSFSLHWSRSCPLYMAVPWSMEAVGPRRPISVLTVTDFPEPDSPTMASTSPR